MFVKREMGRSWGQSSLAAVGAVAGHATGPYWHGRAGEVQPGRPCQRRRMARLGAKTDGENWRLRAPWSRSRAHSACQRQKPVPVLQLDQLALHLAGC